jgi:hypothetical protein
MQISLHDYKAYLYLVNQGGGSSACRSTHPSPLAKGIVGRRHSAQKNARALRECAARSECCAVSR